MLMGTSLTFYRGPKFTTTARKARRVTGPPSSTTSQSVVDGLRLFKAEESRGLDRLFAGFVWNDKLTELLEYNGFKVQSLECFAITAFRWRRHRQGEQAIIELTGRAIGSGPRPMRSLITRRPRPNATTSILFRSQNRAALTRLPAVYIDPDRLSGRRCNSCESSGGSTARPYAGGGQAPAWRNFAAAPYLRRSWIFRHGRLVPAINGALILCRKQRRRGCPLPHDRAP